MGFADNMRTLSNINATLASLVTYGQQRQIGVPAQTAAMNLFGNMAVQPHYLLQILTLG